MLALGSSRPWPDAMEVLTGNRKIDASAILEYFEPLKNWLIKTNKASGAYIGWKKSYSMYFYLFVISMSKHLYFLQNAPNIEDRF